MRTEDGLETCRSFSILHSPFDGDLMIRILSANIFCDSLSHNLTKALDTGSGTLNFPKTVILPEKAGVIQPCYHASCFIRHLGMSNETTIHQQNLEYFAEKGFVNRLS